MSPADRNPPEGFGQEGLGRPDDERSDQSTCVQNGYWDRDLNDDASFAVPALIIAAILIIGLCFVITYNSENVQTRSGSMEPTTITRSA